jgi:hypothetical protein
VPPEHDPPVYPERDELEDDEGALSGDIVFDENRVPG